jgi:hypothetical protein
MRVGVKRMGISDNYCPGYGDREWMRSFYGLDTGSIVSEILNWHPHAGCKAKKEPPAPKDSCFKLALDDFSRIFAASGKDMPGECVKFAAHADFGYSVPLQEAQEKIILDILKTIDSNSLSVAGPHRKDAWEKGWSQNLRNFTQSNFDLSELVPKFVKPKGMIRLEGRYILPDSQDFETAFVTMLRFYLFRKYFSEVNSVYEFGCGTGLNLVALARMFPDKRLFGLDWSRVSCEIIDRIAQTKKMNLSGALFDMFEPDYKLKLAPGSAVFTIGAMEQLGKNFAPFLSFLLKKKPSICINIETLYELYSPDSLFDYAAAKYIEKRGYLQGYLSRLRQLEQEKKVQIIKVQRTFGNLYHDGYSFVIWRPRG